MKKIILTIILSILFCFIILFIKNEYAYHLLDNANFGMPYLIKKKSINNLFIGTSIFRQGLDPSEIKNDSYILTYNGNQIIMQEWILNHLLENNVKINNLYIDLYPYLLSNEPYISDGKLFLEEDIKGKFEIFEKNEKNFSNFYHMFILENNEVLATWPIYYNIINNTYLNGGQITGKNGIDEDTINNLASLDVEYKIEELQKTSLINIIKTCKEKNINLIFIEIPKYKKIKNEEVYQKLLKDYINILDKYNISYILGKDMDSISDDSYNYFDLIHLSNKGRKEYTKLLFEKLK